MAWRDGAACEYEQQLLKRAAAAVNRCDAPALSPENLSVLAHREGTDFVTAWLYQRLRAADAHGPFIQRVESEPRKPASPRDFEATLTIVPGAFYREFPQSGADGRIIHDAVRSSGRQVELIPTQSFGGLDESAERICRWLLQQPQRPRVLVSLCKGSAELKLAFARPEAAEAFQQVRAWVNLSGIVFGTPMANWVLAHRLRRWWYALLLGMRGYDYGVVRQLGRHPDQPLAGELQTPAGLRMVHVFGFPLKHHLTTQLAKRCYRRNLPLGPNDGGGVLLADACRLPGHVYPVWGADHYLRPAGRDMSRLILAILSELSDSEQKPTPIESQAGSAS